MQELPRTIIACFLPLVVGENRMIHGIQESGRIKVPALGCNTSNCVESIP